MWVLIVWMLGASNALATHDFETEKACRDAFIAMKDVNHGETYLRGVCIPKGDK